MQAQILAPAAVLVAWSIVMLLWAAAVRFPAMAKQGVKLGTAPAGARGQDLEGVVPANVQWKSHNYTHLMEQPTIFYATVVILALMGPSALDVTLAWVYVALRVVHSVWQSTVNRISVRLGLFVLGTICLAVMAGHALRLTMGF